MTLFSVNINKIALIRNSRGANYPDLIKSALDCERYGPQGITVPPRPGQR
ncbi:MAG TPA: pyridoxine 5'-phosphate synthase, partial [Saprospiraceae bacterium]|nr:pyridoxine 5'-phosphate synthase [Saprospiraceae bacterium]